MGIHITSLSSVKSLDEQISPEQEAVLVTQAIKDIRAEARRLLFERLKSGERFRLIPPERVDAAVDGLGLKPGTAPTVEQLVTLRTKLDVDLVVGGVVQDYGKVRWQWLAAGMFGDMTWESVALGIATAWNPAAIFGNIGFELLTSTPVWLGGGHLFGAAFRPVRVEAWAVESQRGEEVWDDMDVSAYLWKRLKELPEDERSKKEAQLHVNLMKSMEALGDSLLDEGLTKTKLWERRLSRQDNVAF
jgi:hypothetical protein